jgi:CheY-like chemotaxis protein
MFLQLNIFIIFLLCRPFFMKPLLLVVDDDIDDIELIQDALNQIQDGPELRYFLSAEDLLKFFREESDTSLPPFAITLDINLPDMDGIALLAILKKEFGMEYIPISIVTASNSIKQKVQCLEYGADNFFTKPVKISDWLTIIQSVVQNTNVPK